MLHDSVPLFCFLVLHEAVSTGDPEMVYTVLQHRDYHNTSMALEGVPELLHKILEVAIRLTMPNAEPNITSVSGDSSTALGVLPKSSLPNSANFLLSCWSEGPRPGYVSGARRLPFLVPL